MRFTLYRIRQPPSEYWNGKQQLPDELHVTSPTISIAEFQLIALLCSLHGWITPYDLLTGTDENTEKDRDIVAILTAFQWYVYPRMPLAGYSASGKRIGGGLVSEKGKAQGHGQGT